MGGSSGVGGGASTDDDGDGDDDDDAGEAAAATRSRRHSHAQRNSINNTSIDSIPDPSDPYGYRRLAGPQLLPEYHMQHVIPRRKLRQRRQRGTWFDRQRRLTAVFTLLCLVALLASAAGWWFARDEDLRGRLPRGE